MAIIKDNNVRFYIDNKLKHNIDVLVDATKDNDDLLIIIDGKERSGKSLLARQIGYYVASRQGLEFGVDNIHFGLKEYIDGSLTSENYSPQILDEARNILNRKSSMSKGTRKFTNYLSECAKKRQCHIIVLPAYHDLDKYVVNWRAKFVINVQKYFVPDSKKDSGFSLKRGEYKVYMADNYLRDSYHYPYRYPKKYEFQGKFDNTEVINVVEYEKKKDENLDEKYHSKFEEEKLHKNEKLWRTRFFKLANYDIQNLGVKQKEIAEIVNMHASDFNKGLVLDIRNNNLINND